MFAWEARKKLTGMSINDTCGYSYTDADREPSLSRDIIAFLDKLACPARRDINVPAY